MYINKYKRPLIIIMLLYLVLNVRAQDVNVLDEIVLEDDRKESPLQVDVINTNISKKKNHDAGSLFLGIPGFGVIKRGGFAMEPVFRGFKYEQLNIQFDGGSTIAPACPNRMDPVTTHITPEEVAKIEIIKGPYSVRYGSSLGGVVNLVTRKPKYEHGRDFRAFVEGGYEVNGSSKFSTFGVAAVKKDWFALVEGGSKRFGNYKSGSGKEIISSFDIDDYSIKTGYSIDSLQSVRVNFRQSFGRDIMHPGLPMDSEIANSTISTFDYDNKFDSNLLRNIKAKMYYSFAEHVMSNKLRPSAKKMGVSTSTTYSDTYGGKVELELGVNEYNIFYLGVDVKNISNKGDNIRINGDKTFNKKIWQDSYLNDYGLFAQYNLYSNNNFSLQTGTRLDYIQSDLLDPAASFEKSNLPLGIHPDDEVNISANISGVYIFLEKWNSKLSLGRGVQTASIQKRYVNVLSVGRDNFNYIGNPLLNAEINNQIDLSINREDEKWWFGVNGYYSIIENYISSEIKSLPKEGVAGIKKFTNIDRAIVFGAEANVGIEIINFLKLDINGFVTNGQNVDKSEPLQEIPPMELNASLMYDNNKWYAKLNQRLVAEQDRISTSVGESITPGFGVLDLFGGYEVNRFFRLDVSITNIFNQNYYEHLSRPYKNSFDESEFYNMGRNIMLGAKFDI